MLESTRLNVGYYNSTGFRADSFKLNLLLVTAAFALCTIGIALPATRDATLWLLAENRPVEVLTFITLLAAGFIGLQLVFKLQGSGETKLFQVFFLLFSVGMILTAMEEIAWGQQFFQFQTPDSLLQINVQKEITLHNIEGLHGKTEYLRLIYGIGGSVGVLLLGRSFLEKISAPLFLLPWFLAITVHSVIDVVNDLAPIQREFDAFISWMAELVELFIGVSALLYVWVNKQKRQGRLRRN